MIFGVIGGGALGLLYAARLGLSGHEVWLWTRTERQAEHLNKEGIILQDGSSVFRVDVKTRALPLAGQWADEAQEAEVLWLAVKQQHIDESLILLLAGITSPSTLVLCLQNGVGHMELLRSRLPDVPFAAVVTTEGAQREDDCTVRYTGRGTLWMEQLDDNKGGSHSVDITGEKQKIVAETMQMAGIEVFLSNEMEDRTYQKLLINSVINPLTALFGVRNGELPADPVRLSLMKALHGESKHILETAGLKVDEKEWSRLLAVCESTSRNESSMLKDIRSGKTTEVDWINGGIVGLARRYGIPAPLNEAVTALIKALH